jgi:sigma-B regulation protein RsbU (phosphoserine phosphatase)
MSLSAMPTPPDKTSLSLEQQVVRLQALLEASRQVHSTIEITDVLHQAARIAVLELELDGAMFTEPRVVFGEVPDDIATADCAVCPRFPLLARNGNLLSELVVVPPDGRELTLYETDFLEGLALQTAVAAENAINHQRHLEYARLAQDLDAARAIQQSLLPQAMPAIPGYSLAARSRACYQVGGDYLDVVVEPDGSHLIVVADVAGKVPVGVSSAGSAVAEADGACGTALPAALGGRDRGAAPVCDSDLCAVGRSIR